MIVFEALLARKSSAKTLLRLLNVQSNLVIADVKNHLFDSVKYRES